MKEIVMSPTLNKRLISRLLSSGSSPRADENFVLKGSSDFTSRSNDVFGELKTLEQAHETWVSENNTNDCFQENDCLDEPRVSRQLSNDPKSLNNPNQAEQTKIYVKEKLDCNESNSDSSLFKKPHSTRLFRRSNVINKAWKPRKKWTKYSLADVPLCSNATNTSVALAFISELRKRKITEQEVCDESKKILFSKPKQKECENVSLSTGKSSSRSYSQTESVSIADKVEKTVDSIRLPHLDDENDITVVL